MTKVRSVCFALFLLAACAWGQANIPATPALSPEMRDFTDFFFLAQTYKARAGTWKLSASQNADYAMDFLDCASAENIFFNAPGNPPHIFRLFPREKFKVVFPSGASFPLYDAGAAWDPWKNGLSLAGLAAPACPYRVRLSVIFDETPEAANNTGGIAIMLEPRITGGKTGIVIRIYKNFFSGKLFDGYLPGDVSPDLIAAWRKKIPEENGRGEDAEKNMRMLAEFQVRMHVLAINAYQMHALLKNDTLERLAACIYFDKDGYKDSASDASACADVIWNFEANMVRAFLDSAKHTPILHEVTSDFLHGKNPYLPAPKFIRKTYFTITNLAPFLQNEARDKAIRDYLRAMLPQAYPRQAARYEPYWNKHK